MQGWGGGHVGVGWVMQGWVGWVMQGLGLLGHEGWVGVDDAGIG